jgi:DNA-binding transcriptional ArsR family regulator
MPMNNSLLEAGPRTHGRDNLRVAACLFRALSDPSRLEILRHLQLGPHRVVDLVDHLGLAQSTVSQHLACLRDCGLVRSQPRGRASEFSLDPDVPVTQLLAAGEQVLDATGAAVALCPTLSQEGGLD